MYWTFNFCAVLIVLIWAFILDPRFSLKSLAGLRFPVRNWLAAPLSSNVLQIDVLLWAEFFAKRSFDERIFLPLLRSLVSGGIETCQQATVYELLCNPVHGTVLLLYESGLSQRWLRIEERTKMAELATWHSYPAVQWTGNRRIPSRDSGSLLCLLFVILCNGLWRERSLQSFRITRPCRFGDCFSGSC